jgi:oligoribonuclease NrnB/cAMP/cGMP phosphodiesterase (DHH superfamily)
MFMNFPIALAIFAAIYKKPNVETFLDERKEKIAENYFNKNEDTTIKDINDRFNSVDHSYSRINTYKYGSRFVGNIGLTDSLLPGYTANSRSGSYQDSQSNSFMMSMDGRFAARLNQHDSFSSNSKLKVKSRSKVVGLPQALESTRP